MDSPIPKPGPACAGPGLEAATPVAVQRLVCRNLHTLRTGCHPENCIRNHPQAALETATLSTHETIPKPRPSGYGLALRRDESQRRVYGQGQALRLPLPSQFTGGGPTPCRRRLNIHRQCPKIGMQKPAYPTDSMLRGGNARAQGWHPQSAPASSCRRQWRQPSLAGERGRIGDGFFPI